MATALSLSYESVKRNSNLSFGWWNAVQVTNQMQQNSSIWEIRKTPLNI